MSNIPCDSMSTIIHPFLCVKERRTGDFRVQKLMCPQCDMVKIVVTRHGTHYRSRILMQGNVNKESISRHNKLFHIRRNTDTILKVLRELA